MSDIDILAMRNLANFGRGSEMTKALHDCLDEVEKLRADLRKCDDSFTIAFSLLTETQVEEFFFKKNLRNGRKQLD